MLPPLTLCAYMKKGPNLRWSLIQCSGGDEGDRTPDLLTASQALSQLSYAPVRRSTIRELGRRCKDNLGKTFCGAARMRDGLESEGPAMPDPARGARPAGGGAAAALPSSAPRTFRDPPSAVFSLQSAARHSRKDYPAAFGPIIGSGRVSICPATSKPCRITGLGREPASTPELAKTKPQVGGLRISRNAGHGRPVRVQPRNPAWF